MGNLAGLAHSTTASILHVCLCVHAWHHKESLNIPITCLRGTPFVWHHTWLLQAWFLHVPLYTHPSMTITSVYEWLLSVFSKYVAMHKLDTHKWNQLLDT